jgi:SAM-dependent methyltransferase
LSTTTEPPDPDGEFLRFWEARLLDPRDPQRERWRALERGQLARNEGIAEAVNTRVPVAGRRCLDVGCQTGAMAIALARRGGEVTAIDVDPTLLEGARLRARSHGASARFVVARAEALPFPARSFDLVTCVDVLEHVDDARAAVAELARVLAPGGALYLYAPNRWSPRNLLSDPHYRLAGVSALPRGLGRFYVTRLRGFPRYDVGVLPVGAAVARWLSREGLELTHSPVLDAERRAHARGFSRPAALALARAWGALRLSTQELFELLARRPG